MELQELFCLFPFQQLAVLFVVRQVVGNMKESLLSYFIAKFKQFQGASGR